MKFDITDTEDTPSVDITPVEELLLSIESAGTVSQADVLTIESSLPGVTIPNRIKNSVTTVKSGNGVADVVRYVRALNGAKPRDNGIELLGDLLDTCKRLNKDRLDNVMRQISTARYGLRELYVPAAISDTIEAEIGSVLDIPVQAMTRSDVIETYSTIDNDFLRFCSSSTAVIGLVDILDVTKACFYANGADTLSTAVHTGTVGEYLADCSACIKKLSITDLSVVCKNLDEHLDYISRYGLPSDVNKSIYEQMAIRSYTKYLLRR